MVKFDKKRRKALHKYKKHDIILTITNVSSPCVTTRI